MSTDATSGRPWTAALGTAVFTSLLFVVCYNACNWLTMQRADAGIWAFECESHWPVVPWMIVPYWSIDLLFVVAPFLCTTRAEVANHRRRIVLVIVGGCLGFLLIPLRFAFARPEVTGVYGDLFRLLYSFDQTGNLFPSLHIALRTVLAAHYAGKFVRSGRWLTHAWFALIGVSTLLTWQHHLVDVLGGFWLGLIALHLYPAGGRRSAGARNVRVAAYYALGAIACTQLARVCWPWTVAATLPAFACGALAFGYCGHGAIYAKSADGRLSFMTRLLWAPLLWGQRLSWWHYRRQSPMVSKLTDTVWLGALPTEREAAALRGHGVTAVLDLTAEFEAPKAFSTVRYLNIPVLDLTAPSREQLLAAASFIEEESSRGVVFVHCKAGYSRTAAAAGAWLLLSGRCGTVRSVLTMLRSVRPGIVVRPEVVKALEDLRT